MNFSSILDISSFFIGMIINLLLVALVSYYFKRKYDHLEKSIDEHSDHIYLLLKKERDALRHIENNTSNFISTIQYNEQKKYPSVVSSNNSNDSDSESDSDSDSDSDNESEYSNESIHPTQTHVDEILELDPMEINIDFDLHPTITVEEISNTEKNEDREKQEEIKQLVIQETKPEETTVFNIQKVDILSQDYNKLTMKQLKDLLSNKGISIKPHMKKNDLIDLASKNSVEIELDTEMSSMSKNPSHISITDCDLELTNLNDTVIPLTET